MAYIQATTQDHLDIEEIKDNLVVLKNGGACAVLQTTAVNFDLLSELEQDSIIAALSMLLNSIGFPVQVVVRSKRLDISNYLEKVYRVEQQIRDPLLRVQAEAYRKFVQETIKQNDVLDKKFYVVIPSGGTIDILPGSNPFDWLNRLFGTHTKRTNVDVTKVLIQAKRDLGPKIDHIVKEFGRLGVKSRQLSTQELVELYFDIYNPTAIHGQRIRTNVEDYKTAIVNPAIIE
ncbi:MAG: hypothetical protein R3B92_01585 [Patescibacteria group bacterium]